MTSQFQSIKQSLPRLGVGLGFRREIAREIFAHIADIDWLEFTPENYMNVGGNSVNLLEIAASRFPLISHGVSLSIGSADELDLAYLTGLRSLLDKFPVAWFSDHICYSNAGGLFLHDLLPLPRSKALVSHIAKRVKQAQEFIQRPMLLENISYYMDMPGAQMSEAQFITEVLQQSDCGLLLDLNNVVVNSINHKFDPIEYLSELPLDRTVQIHMAGHKSYGDYIIDTHGEALTEKAFELLRYVLSRTQVNAIMIERDQNFPEFSVLLDELKEIRKIYRELQTTDGEPSDEERQAVQQAISLFETPANRESNDGIDEDVQVPTSMEGQLPDDLSVFESAQDNVVPLAKGPDDKEPLDYAAMQVAMANYWLKNSPLPRQMRKGKVAQDAKLYSWLIASGHDNTLRTMYPLSAKAMANDWQRVAFDYFRGHTPEHYSLSLFGQPFPDYIESRQDLLENIPFLAELAIFERAKLEIMEAETEVNAMPFNGLKTEEELRELAPVLNPVLTLKSFEYAIPAIAETLRIKGRVDTVEKSETPSPYSLAIFRDPETTRCRISSLSSTATKIILSAIQQRLSYADLIHNFVSRVERTICHHRLSTQSDD